jgi:hypothetical protein
MKSSTLLLAAAFLAAIPTMSQAKIERLVEKTFTVTPGGTLRVETQGGDITVRPGADDRVQVVARQLIRAKSDAEADELLQDLDLTIAQAGDSVTAKARYAKSAAWRHFKSWPPVRVSFEVTVPARFHAELETSGGDISVGDLTGEVQARTSGGDVEVGRIDGTVQVTTSGGDIGLRAATGTVMLNTSGGDIEVGRVEGMAKLTTSGGDIEMAAAAGGLLAKTSGGDIEATFTGELAEDCSLGSSGGDIVVKVPRAAGFQLDASTSGGDVKAAGLTLTIEQGGLGKSKLAGAVNAGGPKLKLRTSGGDIVIRPE